MGAAQLQLPDALVDYLNHARSRRFSPWTLRLRRYQVGAFLEWLAITAGVHTANRLETSHLEAWQRHLTREPPESDRPLKPRTINKYIESIRGFLNHLVKRGELDDSVLTPLVYVKEPRVLPSSVLVHADVQRLLSTINTDSAGGLRDRAMLELAYSSGLRAGEILGLRTGDINWVDGSALVTGKGAKQRVVPIGRSALRHLQTYLKQARPSLLRDSASPALFLDRYGRQMPYHTFRRLVHRHAANARLTVAVTPHTFRRSCTTELIRAGANLYHVKEILGHESLETLKHYTRLTVQDLRRTHSRCHPSERNRDSGRTSGISRLTCHNQEAEIGAPH